MNRPLIHFNKYPRSIRSFYNVWAVYETRGDIDHCRRTNAHGVGKWQGAPGVIWEAVNEGGECRSIGGPCTGFHTQAPGQQGGGPTPFNKAYVLRKNQKIEITEPYLPLDLQAGDHLVTLTGGGAGVGNPAERDPDEVRQDVRNELVSLKSAYNIYRVVIDPMTLEVDYRATEALRHKTNT